MRRTFGVLGAILLSAAAAAGAHAAGTAYRLAGYATAGANPTAVFVVLDSQGNGVRGVPITLTATAGVLSAVSGATGSDGTFAVSQSGGALGDQIRADCAAVSLGTPAIITAAAAQTVKSTDSALVWYDESRRLVNAVVRTVGNGVLTSNSTFNLTVDDRSSDYRTLTVSRNTGLSQTAAGPAQLEILQGTFNPGDRIYADETTVTGGNNGEVYFSTSQPTRLLFACAADGANPSVTAVVTDAKGVGVEGVTVTAAASAGSFAAATLYTNFAGVCTFVQTGGALGDTLTVSCPTLPDAAPALIVTETAPALAATNRVFSWFARKTRRVFTAVVNRASGVLVSSSVLAQNFVNINSNDIYPQNGAFAPQTSKQAAVSGCLTYGTTEVGDLIRIYESSTVARYPNNYHCILELPAAEPQYLLAFATGGANPTVWAVVTNARGNAVPGAPVAFSLQGTGSLSLGNTVTGWGGFVRSEVSGAAATGNTVTVSSPGLGTLTIYTAAAQWPAAADRAYAWYDPSTHRVWAAPVTFENNVLCAEGTTVTADTVKKHVGNNTPYLSNISPVAAPWPCQMNLGFGTNEAGDYIRIYQSSTAVNWETQIQTDPDPAKFLLAFAKGGTDPTVWAVVMDAKGNALEGEPVHFAAEQGSMSLANTVTGYGGIAQSAHTSGVLGNTLTVWASGLPPVTLYTAPAAPLGAGDQGFEWYDATHQAVWGIEFSWTNHVVTSNTNYWVSSVYDNTANDRTFNLNDPVSHDMNRRIYPFAQWSFAQGTAAVGDEMLLGNYSYYSFIRLASVKPAFLRAYAVSGTNPSLVRALVVTQDGIGVPGVNISFSSGTGVMTGGPIWRTGFDGTVDSSQTGGLANDVITVSADGYAPVQIYTYGSGGVSSASETLCWYSTHNRKLNSTVIQYPCYNVTVSGVTPNIAYLPQDNTANGKTLAVTGAREDAQQQPTYGFAASGTSAAGDMIRVQTLITRTTDDAVVVLPADAGRYLWAFAAGGSDPTVWAVVTDAHGNGLPNVPVTFIPTGGSMTLTSTQTDASGATRSAYTGGLGNNIFVAAEGVSNTITVKTAAATPVDATGRALAWYDVMNRTAHAAYINPANQILDSGTIAAFTPVDATPNGQTFALGGELQQTGTQPAQAAVVNGSQGSGDQIWAGESVLAANPAAILTIDVPTSSITSSLEAFPAQVVNGAYFAVTMTVFNNGTPAALTVTPSALTVAGGAVVSSGPDPAFWGLIPGGEARQFSWLYRATAPGGVTLTGQAQGTDSFTTMGVTSTATDSNPVAVRDPHAPVLTAALAAAPGACTVGQTFTATLTVTNASDADVPGALTVTPTALTVAGPAALAAGPSPASWPIPRGESRDFTWTFTATAPGGVTLTGQALAVNPFDYSGVTSTAAASNLVAVQSPPVLAGTFAAPAEAERLLDFSLALTVQNTGQAAAVSVTPVNLIRTGTASATWVSGPTPAQADIPGGASRTFTWVYRAGNANGTLQFSAEAAGFDANTGVVVNALAASTQTIQIIQGVLNLDRVGSDETEAFRGQRGLNVWMQARNTSMTAVTLTAATLEFNGATADFTVTPAADNPLLIPPRSSFTLRFRVDVGRNAPLGQVVLDGAIAGDAGPAGTMSASGAQATAVWRILEPFNQLRQNYPNPLRLSQGEYTTFEYTLQEDVRVTLKIYNLAGELAAVLLDGSPGVGRHTLRWTGDNGDPGARGKPVGSGVYLAVFQAGDYKEIRKVVVIR